MADENSTKKESSQAFQEPVKEDKLKGMGIFTSGMQVDAWGAYVPDRGNLENKIKIGIVKEVKDRGLENLTVAKDVELGIGTTLQALTGTKRSHMLFQQNLGKGTTATFALRVAKKGPKDLELSWRLFEANPTKGFLAGLSQGTIVVFGIAWILMSLPFLPFGVGFCLIPIGLFIIGVGMGWWGKDIGKTRATALEQFDSRVLAQSIDFSLMKTLEGLGISQDEIRVIEAADMEGIGKLG